MRTITFYLFMVFVISSAGDFVITKRSNNYIREGAGSFYPLVEIVKSEVKLTVVEKKGNWLKVKLPGGKEGWIGANSIKKREEKPEDVFDFSDKESSTQVSRTGLAAAIKGLKGRSDIKFARYYENLDELVKPRISNEEFNEFRKTFFETENENDDLEIEDLDFEEVEYEQDIESQTIGYGIAARLLSKDAINNNEFNKYLALITNHLIASNRFYDVNINTIMLNSELVDGYSCPGGYVFITKGAVGRCENEAELAGIIAHEISHLILNHGLAELTKRKTAIKMEKVFNELEQETGSAKSDTEKELDDMIMNGYEKVMHNRLLSYEEQADKSASVIMARAGYDCSTFASFINRISNLYTKSNDIFDPSYLKPNDVALRAKSLNEFLEEDFEGEISGLRLTERFSKNCSLIK